MGIEVLKFLHNTFGLTADDARADDNYALRLAAENGHLEELSCLHDTFGLTDVDARAGDNYALRLSAEKCTFRCAEVLSMIRLSQRLLMQELMIIMR